MTDSHDDDRPLAPNATPLQDPMHLAPALQFAPWAASAREQPRYARQIEAALLRDLANLRH